MKKKSMLRYKMRSRKVRRSSLRKKLSRRNYRKKAKRVLRKNTRRKNTRRKNTWRKNTRRKNTRRKNTRRKNTWRKNTRRGGGDGATGHTSGRRGLQERRGSLPSDEVGQIETAMAELRSQPAVMKAARKKAIQEEKAAGDADEPMTLGTKVKLTEDTEVSVGTYDRFVRKRVGANDHYMFFDDDDECIKWNVDPTLGCGGEVKEKNC